MDLKTPGIVGICLVALALGSSPAEARGGDELRIHCKLAASRGPASGAADYRKRGNRERFSVEVERLPKGEYSIRVGQSCLDATLDSLNCPADLNMDTDFSALDLLANCVAVGGKRAAFEDAAVLTVGSEVRVFSGAGCQGTAVLAGQCR